MARTPDIVLKERAKRRRWWLKLRKNPKRYKAYKDNRKARVARLRAAGVCINCGQPLANRKTVARNTHNNNKK